MKDPGLVATISQTTSSSLTLCADFTVDLRTNRDVRAPDEYRKNFRAEPEGIESNGKRTVRGESIDRSVNMDDTFGVRVDQVSTFQPKRRFRLSSLPFLPYLSLFLVFLSSASAG